MAIKQGNISWFAPLSLNRTFWAVLEPLEVSSLKLSMKSLLARVRAEAYIRTPSRYFKLFHQCITLVLNICVYASNRPVHSCAIR
jgi:hypothetical protein